MLDIAEHFFSKAGSLLGNDSVARRSIVRRVSGVYRPADDPVAFTRRDFEPLGIEKGEPAAGITNQPLQLQRAGRQADAAARNTQYLGHRLVSEIESSIARPVAR